MNESNQSTVQLLQTKTEVKFKTVSREATQLQIFRVAVEVVLFSSVANAIGEIMPALMGMKNKKNLDEGLKQLALEAQRYPPGSLQRQKALTKLIRGMQRSGKLSRPRALGFAGGMLTEVQETAYQQLFLYICNNIEKFDSQKGDVLQWANFLLKQRFFGAAMKEIMEGIPQKRFTKEISMVAVDIAELEAIPAYQLENNLSLSQQLIQYLEEDPEKLFEKTYIAGHPDVDFQVVALKIVAGYSWKELASEFNVEISTLSSFYYRCLKKFSNRFKQALMR